MSAIVNISRFIATHPLAQEAPLKTWLRVLLWQIRSRLQEEVIWPWIEGQQLAVRKGMRGATGNIYAGLHEFPDMMLLLHFLRSEDLFLDIGANVGSFTVLASGVRGATTWAFEPDPAALAALTRNIEINGLRDRVVVHECALGDRDGRGLFTTGLDSLNRIATVGEENTRVISVRTIDGIIGERRPVMIKMDAEGYEDSIVRGAKHLLGRDDVKIVEIETVAPEVEIFLNRNGFRRGYYDPLSRDLAEHPHKGISSSNSLFVRDWEFVVSRLISGPSVNVLHRSI
jgi:FkbM family methyltransferase